MEDAIAFFFVKHEFHKGCTRWNDFVFCLTPPGPCDPFSEEQLIYCVNGGQAHCKKLMTMMQEFYPTVQFKYHPAQKSRSNVRRMENGDHDLQHILVVFDETNIHLYCEFKEAVKRLDNLSWKRAHFRERNERLIAVFPSLMYGQPNGSTLFQFLKRCFEHPL